VVATAAGSVARVCLRRCEGTAVVVRASDADGDVDRLVAVAARKVLEEV
jgi:hypothetical protein